MSPFSVLSRPTLLRLAAALETHRLQPPFSTISLTLDLPLASRNEIMTELRRLSEEGMSDRHIAYLLRAIGQEREQTQSTRDRTELVWTANFNHQMRETKVVVQELLANATQRVLITSYAIDSPAKAKELFAPLAQQMETYPHLEVVLGINIPRRWGDNQTSDGELLANFARFFRSCWQGKQLPQVFYDPRSLSQDFSKRGCLHAKCIVLDGEQVFVTSANFTEAAYHRNIEAGVLLADSELAQSLHAQFDMLVRAKHLLPLAFS